MTTNTSHRLAQVAGRLCHRSLAEMEHAALVLIAEHDQHVGRAEYLVGFLSDVVRLVREVGDRHHDDPMLKRPGGDRLL